MSSRVATLRKRFYPHGSRNSQQVLLQQLQQVLTPEYTLLDVGAGRGGFKELDFRGRVRRSCGVDVDPAVLQNEMLDEARVLQNDCIPYPDQAFDVAYSRFVWEHLEHPQQVLREVYRVLKTGGRYVSLTPNRFHYVPLVATCTPFWFHRWAVVRSSEREESDVFPTYYRLNTRRTIRSLSRQAGFKVERIISFEAPPRYLNFNSALYLLGIACERVLNSTSLLTGLRSSLVVTLQREE